MRPLSTLFAYPVKPNVRKSRIDAQISFCTLLAMTSDELRKLMDRRKLTAAKLAAKVFVSERTVEGWLQGRPMSKMADAMLRRLK